MVQFLLVIAQLINGIGVSQPKMFVHFLYTFLESDQILSKTDNQKGFFEVL